MEETSAHEKTLQNKVLKDFKNTGNTYFRTGGHYHRLRKLDFCVRDGNRYNLSDMVTGKTLAAYSPAKA